MNIISAGAIAPELPQPIASEKSAFLFLIFEGAGVEGAPNYLES